MSTPIGRDGLERAVIPAAPTPSYVRDPSTLSPFPSIPIGRTGLSTFTTAEQNTLVEVGRTNYSTLFDDFFGDALDPRWNVAKGTDAAAAAGILAGGVGGVMELTTGEAGTGLAADMVVVNHGLQWNAVNGGLTLEARLQLSAITDCYFFVGFTDTLALEAPIMASGTANGLTSNASTAVGFMFDTRMTADTLWSVGVMSDVDAVPHNTAALFLAGEYKTLRIQIDAMGTALFFIDDVQVGPAMATAIVIDTPLTPVIAASKTAVAESMWVEVDYIAVSMKNLVSDVEPSRRVPSPAPMSGGHGGHL